MNKQVGCQARGEDKRVNGWKGRPARGDSARRCLGGIARTQPRPSSEESVSHEKGWRSMDEPLHQTGSDAMISRMLSGAPP